MKINSPSVYRPRTYEGGAAVSPGSNERELLRAVMSCMLWEDQFYENGVAIADRIAALVAGSHADTVATIAVVAREQMNLRHVPLFLCRELARRGRLRADTLTRVIQRADELSEFLAIYWKDGRQPLSKQVKLGLANAFKKFNGYALAKYNQDNAIKLRDVMFLVHPHPESSTQAETWKQLVDGSLAAPDTWEVALSAGVDKATTFTRLIVENKLGALALLRNLRNMQQAGVPDSVIKDGLRHADVSRVFPFRFIAAATHAPQLEPYLEEKMFESLVGTPKLSGKTVVLVDVSGSMGDKLSGKSDMTRIDAACGVAMIARELCDDVSVFTFSDKLCAVPPRRGFGLRDAIMGSQDHNGTYLGRALADVNIHTKYDRIIVITDEQSHDTVGGPTALGYMINVASYRNGVGYGPWTRIEGFSEAVIKYIQAIEGIQ